MSLHPTFRLTLVSLGLFAFALFVAQPFNSQRVTAQQGLPLYDEARTVEDLTRTLQLAPEQAGKLRELIAAHRPRIQQLQQEANGLQPGNPRAGELRAQFERERRAVLQELLSALNPEQQSRARGMLAQPQLPQGPTIAPIKPALPSGALAAGERLIAQPAVANPNPTRSRRAVAAPPLTEEQKILHLLNRAGFGPRPGDVERVRQMGLEKYLDQQLHPEDLSDELLARPLQALNTLQMAGPEIVQTFMPPPPPRPSPTPVAAKEGEMAKQGESEKMAAPVQPTPRPTPTPPQRNPQQAVIELQQAKLLRAVFSERQLQEVMVDFWFNHFNVFAGKDNVRWMLTPYERDVLRPHALGKFKELLTATAQSPAMLYYLDNFQSQVEPPLPPQPPLARKEGDTTPPPPARRPGLNENYGRELLELHTLGVDGGYTQQDVIAVARSFTGWTLTQPPNVGFVFRPRMHDKGEKIVLGTRLAPGGGIEDGLRVIDLLAHHPATAKFIARKLCQRFVADEPPAALVDQIAAVFTKTDGDIRAVVRAILTSPEFYAPKNYRSKIKSPLELTASMLRATGAASEGFALIQWVNRMGEPLYQCVPPTGYSEESARWLNNAALLERLNFALALMQQRVNGTRVELARFVAPNTVNEPSQVPAQLIDQLLALLVHSDVSAETRANLQRALGDMRTKAMPAKFDERTATKNAEQLIGGVAALILGSQEFQVK
ncbi:MAG: DUF1800 domain-containing protein [Acidobacteria bacterium]|nr:DUF1800 domain-containing protein [Acidobacteriota bacterium]MBI3424850.1 DUF1800 domain-containing protein [Acidobacteriota bacterium]